MTSVVTAAPADGASPLAFHKLDKLFGAIHVLEDGVGKWLNRNRLFIFDEPTAGVTSARGRKSVGCSAPQLAKGVGVIMISSCLPEVCRLADTLHVFPAGGLVASHGHKDATQEITLTEAIGV